jgi:hypothetical protein
MSAITVRSRVTRAYPTIPPGTSHATHTSIPGGVIADGTALDAVTKGSSSAREAATCSATAASFPNPTISTCATCATCLTGSPVPAITTSATMPSIADMVRIDQAVFQNKACDSQTST